MPARFPMIWAPTGGYGCKTGRRAGCAGDEVFRQLLDRAAGMAGTTRVRSVPEDAPLAGYAAAGPVTRALHAGRKGMASRVGWPA